MAYKGEIDKQGKACGHGTAHLVDDPLIYYTGTFLDNQLCGITVYSNRGRKVEYESKENRCHGKQTDYSRTRGAYNAHNVIVNHGEIANASCKPIDRANFVFYREGKAVMALQPNFGDYV